MTANPVAYLPTARYGHLHLLALKDALRPLADPVEIQAAASQMLCRVLHANRVAYFELRGDEYVIERDEVDGVVSIAGSYPVSSFGQRLLDHYRAGRVAVCNDVQADAALSLGERAAYAAIGVGAYVGVPLIKNGAFVVGLGT